MAHVGRHLGRPASYPGPANGQDTVRLPKTAAGPGAALPLASCRSAWHQETVQPVAQTAPPELAVLYRDEALVAVAKPSGMLVHNGWAREAHPALQLVRGLVGQYVYPVHRLDRGTSGVLMFALSSAMARQMQEVLHNTESVKLYLALVRGITPEAGCIDHALAQRKGAEKRAARTRFVRLGSFERYSLVLANPLTGRLHQIRRHMKHLSHPLIGDVRYGKSEHNRLLGERFGLRRLALHSLSFEFSHPTTQQRILLQAPLPADLCEPLARMGFGPTLWNSRRFPVFA